MGKKYACELSFLVIGFLRTIILVMHVAFFESFSFVFPHWDYVLKELGGDWGHLLTIAFKWEQLILWASCYNIIFNNLKMSIESWMFTVDWLVNRSVVMPRWEGIWCLPSLISHSWCKEPRSTESEMIFLLVI